jgi:hypothetical protein
VRNVVQDRHAVLMRWLERRIKLGPYDNTENDRMLAG